MTDNDKKLIKEFRIKMPGINELLPISQDEKHSFHCVAYGWFRAKGAGPEKATFLAKEAVKVE